MVFWEAKEHIVDGGIMEYDLMIAFENPCNEVPYTLHNINASVMEKEIIKEALRQCNKLFEDEVIERLQKMSQQPQNIQAKTNEILGTNLRMPRQISGLAAGSAAAGAAGGALVNIVTNCITSVLEYFNPNSNYNRINRIETQVDQFNKNFDILKTIARSLVDTMEVRDKKIWDAIYSIEQTQLNMQRLSGLFDIVKAKIIEMGSVLNALGESLEIGQIEPHALQRITKKANQIQKVAARDTMVIKTELVSNNKLQLIYRARKPSSDSIVYQVDAFRHWSNLTERESTLMEYAGPEFIIWNRTANCVKTIRPPQTRVVSERCEIQGARDEKLSQWIIAEKTTDLLSIKSVAQEKRSLSHSYIYCFPQYIRVAGVNISCPTEVMKIPVTLGYETQGAHYQPEFTNQSVVARALNIVDNIYLNDSELHRSYDQDYIVALKTMRKEADEIKTKFDKSIKIEWYSPGWFIMVGMILLIVILITVAIMLYCTKTPMGARNHDRDRYSALAELSSRSSQIGF